MRQLLALLPILLTLLLGAGLSTPAQAIDCTKAASAVERAICTQPDLKAADTKLSAVYFGTLKTLSGRPHDLLQSFQRDFLAARDAACADGRTFDCVAEWIETQTDAIPVCFAGKPGETTNCGYFSQTTCPTLEGGGSPGLIRYPFLIDNMAKRLQADAKVFECVNDPDNGIDAANNDAAYTMTIVTERAGLVCVDTENSGMYAGAAHPFNAEALECYDTNTEKPLPFATVFPTATPDAEGTARLIAAADGHLTASCCNSDTSGGNENTFADLNIDTPEITGWAIDPQGELILGFAYDIYGRGFMATAPVPASVFMPTVAPPYIKYFLPAP